MKNPHKDNHLFRSEEDRYSRSPLRNWKVTTFVLLLITLYGLVVQAQSVDLSKLPTNDDGSVQFQDVVKIDSATSAKELISRARSWAGKAYKSASTTVEQYDPEKGLLVVNARMDTTTIMSVGRISRPINHLIGYKVTVETKPGRYRVSFSDMSQESSNAYTRIGPRALPSSPQGLPSSNVGSGAAAVEKARGAYHDQEVVLYHQINQYFLASMADLKKAMLLPVSTTDKKDW